MASLKTVRTPIMIFTSVSLCLSVYLYAFKKTKGNIKKSLRFTLYFLSIKIGLIAFNNDRELNQNRSPDQICKHETGIIYFHPYVSILDESRSSFLEMENIKEPIFQASLKTNSVINQLRAGDEVPSRGGAIDHLWSPRAKYESTKAARAAKANKRSSTKRPNLRRRLLSIPGSDSDSRRQIPNSDYKKSAPSMNDNIPKSGNGVRVKSIRKTDENGEMETIYYNKDGQIIDGPAESKFLDDVDLASDVSLNPTDPHIQSETKIQTETVHNQNSGLTKARNNLTPVQDDRLRHEGDFVNPSQLTSKGRSTIYKTRKRRAAPLLQSRYEEKDKEFFPAYSVSQGGKKNKHTLKVLEKLGKNITKYNELPEGEQLQIDFTIVEGLLAHPDTELYTNVMGQGREPIALVLNRGLGDYPLPNHISTFERRPEICKYNSYISNYLAEPGQIENFDASNSSSITYQDLVGNSHTNIGPVFGKTASTTSAPTVNDVNSEL